MSLFNHTDGMRHLLEDLFEINTRIVCGDMASPKAAINSDRARKLLNYYADALTEDGATKVSLKLYIAAGGWVGVCYSYEIDGFEISGSQSPHP